MYKLYFLLPGVARGTGFSTIDSFHHLVLLTLENARDCHATCLLRSGVSIEKISEMPGHSITLVTSHYPGGMNLDESFDTNSSYTIFK